MLPDDGREFLDSLGLHDAVLGVKDVDYRRRHIFEPTCTINGLTSGYQGQGTKTVLPARASAKLDFRLVDDQDPEDIIAKLRAHLERFGFDDIVVKQSSSERAARTPMDDPFIDVAQAGRARRLRPRGLPRAEHGGDGADVPLRARSRPARP